ncbi:MAG: efflux RND transporter periplasmic adaptor subunit [Kiloniellales bacterium]|nr:efflux RND transporter periplasmic adaptor subunit [Kiloniellales bacterium]
MRAKRRRRVAALLGLLGLSPLLSACEEQNTYVAPPAPKVTAARPLVQDVTEYLEFTGTTVAYARVEVPARVPGVLRSLHFEVGTPVNEGELLFTIDPVEYEAQVQAAEAELARAEARRTETAKALERAETLIKRGNISQARVDEAEADFLSAKAEVLVREANLTRARINLGYTRVTAPITGRVGRNLVDVGNLVGQGEATILTDITTYDPIYVYFEVNERDLLRYLAMNRKEAPDDSPAGRRETMPIEVGLANEEGFPHRGITDFAESQVDPDTGTIRVRGVVPNPGQDPVFLPGLFVRIRLPFETRPDVPLVAERAVGFDQGGQYLLVVSAENVVEKRRVALGPLVDGLRVVTGGIGPDDRVVVNGLQRAREGITVQAAEIDMARLTASAIEAGGASDSDRQTDDKGASIDDGAPVDAGLAEEPAPSRDAAAPAPPPASPPASPKD